jgi:hypothetical protein
MIQCLWKSCYTNCTLYLHCYDRNRHSPSCCGNLSQHLSVACSLSLSRMRTCSTSSIGRTLNAKYSSFLSASTVVTHLYRGECFYLIIMNNKLIVGLLLFISVLLSPLILSCFCSSSRYITIFIRGRNSTYMNAINIFTTYSYTIHFNIILPSTHN